jgi:D-3-phosphoglycerate dehydrogenase / 2-oxoglutarate reductase
MKVLIADKFEQSGIDGLKALGCDVVSQPDLKDDALTAAIRESGANVLIVRSTKVTEPMLDAGRLALIVRAGAGYNTIDVAAASKRGIYVSNCPGKNAIAVAELTMGLVLALDRRIPDNVAELRAGHWNKKEYSKARGVFGQVLGLLGLGNISVEVAKRAMAFGMPVVAWSRRFDGEQRPTTGAETAALGLSAPVRLLPSPVAVAGACDVLSVHLALARDLRGLVGAAIFGAMKMGATFVNTSRGELVDHAALEAAVKEKGLRVGLDVFANEPASAVADFVDPLAGLPSVYGTHHIGASTDQAQEAIAAETVRIVCSYIETGRVPNVVNLCKQTPATHMLVVRHRDRPGVLAHVFDHLRRSQLNVQETENIVFDGAEAAIARINLDGAPTASTLDEMTTGNADILDLHVVTL